MEHASKTPDKGMGVFCILMSALLFSIGGLCIKVIPWSGMAINGARTLVALFVIGGYLIAIRHKPRFNQWILLGSLCVCGTNVLFTLANKMTTAANSIVLQFTAPIFVIFLSAIFWGKKPKKRDVIACVAVFLGVICCFVDSLEASGMVGNLLALISGLTYSVVFLLNDLPDGDPISCVFWGDIISMVTGLPFVTGETDFSPVTIVSILALGALQVGAAYTLMTIGLKTTPPVTASLISGIEPVLNPIIVAVFYHEFIGPMALVGAVIVIGAVLIYNVLNAKHDAVKESVSI